MAGRVFRRDDDLAKLKTIAIFHPFIFKSVFRATFVAGINLRRFQSRAEFARAAHQIGMDMRFENVRDGDTGFARHVDVNVAIGTRIKNRSHAFIIIAHEIGKLGDAFGLDGFKDERHAPI
jgi:hypothetical protein